MAELTQEQVERAAGALFGRPMNLPLGFDVYAGLRAAAPFLQLPWDTPTIEEATKANRCMDGQSAIFDFLRHRNAAIMLPKPVTPTGFEGWKIRGEDGMVRDVTEQDVSKAVSNFMREHPPQSYSDDHVG